MSNEILKQFLQNCIEPANINELIFASNGVLELFGKTVRGSKKIFQYFRYDLSYQYEHEFESSRVCEPFEISDIHMETRQEPPENFILPAQIESNESITSVTPPSQGITLSHTPPPIRTRKKPRNIDKKPDQSLFTPSRQLHSDSLEMMPLSDSDEDDRLSMDSVKPNNKPNRKRSNQSDLILYQKKRKSNDEPDGSFIKSTNNLHATDRIEPSSQYSSLQYIESVGILKLIKSPKHHGLTNHNATVPTTTTIQESPNSHFRRAKLKIAYRQRCTDGTVQFALIIYENQLKNIQMRRNLLNEFNASLLSDMNKMKLERMATETKSQRSKKSAKVKASPLKRLRF